MSRVLVSWAEQTTANLGVRVLAEGAAALVRRVRPEAEVVTQSYGHGPAPINIGIPRSLLREAALNSRGGRDWVKSFDLVIDMRAGDSFADIYGRPRLRAQSAFAQFVSFCGVPLVMGPQTIGPFRTMEGRLIGKHSMRLADLVMARDHISAEVAAEMGRPVDVLTTDVVFALAIPDAAEPRDVVVNVSGLLWDSDDHGPKDSYRETVRTLLQGLQSRGREITLLAHVLDADRSDRDGPTVAALAQEFGVEAIVPESLEQVRSTLRGSELAIGSRMHACLNSLSVGTPAVALAYSRKFRPLLSDVGWEHVVSLADSHPAEQALRIVDDGEALKDDARKARARADVLLEEAAVALGAQL